MIRLHIPQHSAMLEAHFPGHPIVPGAALLDMVLHACAAPAHCTVTAKFLRPVRPGELLEIHTPAITDTGLQKFEVRVGEHTVCSGQFKP
jgi:3-hydroxyacyl-[acyl-carrier-protein] dehydratase